MKKKNTRIRRRKYNSRKKFIFPLICLCILLGVSVVGVFATIGDSFDDPITGLTFKVTDETEGTDGKVIGGTVTITGYSTGATSPAIDTNGVLTIPSTVKRTLSDTSGVSYEVYYQVTAVGENNNTKNVFGNSAPSIKSIVFALDSNLTTINSRAFQECSELQTINFTNADKLETIGEAAFDKCKKLGTELDFSGATALKTIDTYAFKECSRLRNVKLDGTSLTTINNTAFSNCINLRRVSLPDTIATIGKKAFYNCPWLTDFPNLSGSGVSIGEGAFWGCCYIDGNKFPDDSDPFDKDTVLKYLNAQLRGVSITKIIPSNGEENSVSNDSPVPRRFFKGQEYKIIFDPAGEYKIKGLDLLTPEEEIPTTYSISSEFTPNTSGKTDYSFTIPADWKSDSFIIFAAATVDPAESGAPTILTKELPPGLVKEPYQATLEVSSDSPIDKWSVGWRYANEEPGEIKEGLPAGLTLQNAGSTVSKYIAGTPAEGTAGHYIITVTVKNAVSSHTKSYDLHIYDKSLPSMTELKWKESNGDILTAWTPLQNTTATSINYVIRIYDEEGNLVGTDEKPLPGTETFESKFAELDVTNIVENAGKGVYTFTVTAESDGYARSFADSKSWPEKGYYAYGYENYTITATSSTIGYGTISLSEKSYDIPSLKAEQITDGVKVTVREGAVTSTTPLSFIFTPNAGCEITSLTVDGNPITGQDLGSYTFNDLPESTEESHSYDREVIVEFSLVDNTIGGEIVQKVSYVQGEKAAFQAFGHNMGVVGEVDGATRWEPKFWRLDDSTTEHHWEGDTYTDNIDTTNLAYGKHTLYVTFQQQRYVNGMGWQDVEGSHAIDVRSVEFIVTDKSGNVPDTPGGDTSGGDTSGGGTSGGGTSGGGTSGGGGGIVDAITSYAAGVATGDNMALGMWSALALVSLCGIGFCIRQMFKFA